MNHDETKKVCEQWVNAWNSADIEGLKALYSEDTILYQAPIKQTLVGIDNIVARFKIFKQMADDGKLAIRDMHLQEDSAILEVNLTGTNTGPFINFEPTGRRIDIDTCLSFKIKNNKIIKHITYLDTLSVLRALGLISVPETRPEAA